MAVSLREFFFPIEPTVPEKPKTSSYPEPRRPTGIRPPATEAEAAAAAIKIVFGPLNWVDDQRARDVRAKPWKRVSFGGRFGQDPSGEDYALDLRGNWRTFLTHPAKTVKTAAKRLVIRKAYDAMQGKALKHYHNLLQAGKISQQDHTKFVGRVDKALEWVGPRNWKKIQTPQGIRKITTSLTKGSGKLWEWMEFIDKPIGYTMRKVVWKKGVKPAISKITSPITKPIRKFIKTKIKTPIKQAVKKGAKKAASFAKRAAKSLVQKAAPVVKQALVAAGKALITVGTHVITFIGSAISSLLAAVASALSASTAAVIAVVVIVLLLILALLVIIGTKAAFIPPGAGGLEEQLVRVSKTVVPGNIPADGNSYSVTYTITATNNSDEDAEVTLRDETYDRDFSATVPARVANQTVGSFTVSVPTQVGVDEIIVNTVAGEAVMASETISLGASGILIVGEPSGQPPSGWPTDRGCVTQGPGGSFSHGGIEALDVGKVTGDFGVHKVYATHDGTAYAYIGPDGPFSAAAGKYVEVISHGGTFKTYYVHLFSHSISSGGVAVERGTELGIMGETGSAKGVHVHYQFGAGGTYEGDPLKMDPPYIPADVRGCSDACGCCFSGSGGACGSGP